MAAAVQMDLDSAEDGESRDALMSQFNPGCLACLMSTDGDLSSCMPEPTASCTAADASNYVDVVTCDNAPGCDEDPLIPLFSQACLTCLMSAARDEQHGAQPAATLYMAHARSHVFAAQRPPHSRAVASRRARGSSTM